MSEYHQELSHDITLIDTGLMGEKTTACYLLQSSGEVAIIETGHYKTTQRIVALLDSKNINTSQVKYIIPTHVHLDHAGGASSLMEHFPEATLIIHPRGARHMINPEKLIKGATAVYGEEKFKVMYGNIHPIPEARVRIAEDGDCVKVGQRTLQFRDTPGHASHHFCIWDAESQGWFTGDTFGIAYPQLSAGSKRLLFPTTTPIQFNPEALKNSIRLLHSYQPKKMYLTHYGEIECSEEIVENLIAQVDDYVSMVQSLGDGVDQQKQLESELSHYYHEKLRKIGCKLTAAEVDTSLRMDTNLNAQGLLFWFKHRA